MGRLQAHWRSFGLPGAVFGRGPASSFFRGSLAAVLCGAIAWSPLPSQAQDNYPSRPVKMLVPYAPGGATDIIARHIANRLNEVLGQSFLVENRAGAAGNIALEAAVKAAPDGYTLLVGNVSTNAINESTFADVIPVKPSRDLIGITKLVEIPHVILANASFPPNNVAGLIDYLKKNPGKVNYASAGIGTYPHLDMLKLIKATGTEMTHVPYNGGAGQIIPALVSNQVQISFLNLSSSLEQIRAGKLKAIATTAPARLTELPAVATMAEQGFAGIGTNAWQALFAPTATPKPVVDKLFNAVTSVLSRPDMRDMLNKQMMTVMLSKSPQEFTELVIRETRSWGEFVRENKIKISK